MRPAPDQPGGSAALMIVQCLFAIIKRLCV